MLASFLSALGEKLYSLVIDECIIGKLTGDFRNDFENMRRTLLMIQDVLEDAEERQVEEKAIQNWLRQLKDVVYDAQDILEEVESGTEALRREVEPVSGIKRKASAILSASNPFGFHQSMGRKIKEIRQRLDEIAEERSKFHLKVGVHKLEIRRRQEETESLVNESEVYGREEDKKKLMKILIPASDNDDTLSVIPITGMGGLGKTTLAQLAYNDTKVEKHFDLRIWVCISDQFDVGRVTKTMIENITRTPFGLQAMDSLQRKLREELNGKKFLLVLDDVWEENPNKWDQLKKFLRSGSSSGKVIVTTRSKKVASIMGTLPPHELATLSEDECWSIFKQRAFSQGRQEEPILVTLGKEIVKKCGGVPLAAKALGSSMYFKTEQRYWQFVKESEIWNLPEEVHPILPALKLSYYQLPSHLKRCFAYCSIFLKDSNINKKQLIRLWIAQGFIPSTPTSQGCKQMEEEDIGAEYFNDLLWRSFFQDVEKDEYGNIIWCKMHDLMHDLAQSVAGDECSIVKVDSKDMIIPHRCRHLSLVYGWEEEVLIVPSASNKGRYMRIVHRKEVSIVPTALNKAKNLRTLQFILPGHYSLHPGNISIHFLHLRVLDLRGVLDLSGPTKLEATMRVRKKSYSLLKELLGSIGELKQLRYLDLSHTHIQSLPDSITDLYNLQTLRLLKCHYLKELPRDMGKMTKLRHLEINEDAFSTLPAKIGELKFLHTLPVFIVGKESGFGIRELQCLNHLGGDLCIRDLENVTDATEAQEAKLKEKPNLQALKFYWGEKIDDATLRDLNVEQTLDGLQPHPNLKSLKLKDYPGVSFPCWMMMGLLPNLVEVELFSCKRCEQVPSLGKLPHLKVLKIYGMQAVKYIGNHFCGDDENTVGFPSIKEFSLTNMTNLKEWSTGRQIAFPLLQTLTIAGCPQLTKVSAGLCGFPCMQDLVVMSCPELTTFLAEQRFGSPRLEEVCVQDCPKLTTLPSLGSVKRLDLFGGHSTLLHSVVHATSLSSLRISCFEEVESLPDGMLRNHPHLSTLSIEFFPKLESLSRGLGNPAAASTTALQCCNELVELHNLTSLRELSILECNGLRSLRLLGLTSIQRLIIGQCRSLTMTVLEGMQDQLPASLEYLEITECPKLASLFLDLEMHRLTNFDINGCDNLTCLPQGLKHAANTLRELRIWKCPSLTALPEWIADLSSLRSLEIGECHNLVSFPSRLQQLTSFSISECHNLVSLPSRLQQLTSFSISECHKLTCVPQGLKHATNLTSLCISECSNLTALPDWIANLSSLQHLDIHGCPNFVSSPSPLQHLTTFSISRCEKLKCLPEGLKHATTTLRELRICKCPSLTALPDWIADLSSLQHLEIQECPNIVSLPSPLQHLTSFWIIGCEKLKCLPVGLKHATTTLRELRIGNCPSLTALPEWIADLSSLQIMHIHDCAHLVSLPSGFRHLENLQKLTIWGCPQLKKRCAKVGGEDRQKIAHIPNINTIAFNSDDDTDSP